MVFFRERKKCLFVFSQEDQGVFPDNIVIDAVFVELGISREDGLKR